MRKTSFFQWGEMSRAIFLGVKCHLSYKGADVKPHENTDRLYGHPAKGMVSKGNSQGRNAERNRKGAKWVGHNLPARWAPC